MLEAKSQRVAPDHPTDRRAVKPSTGDAGYAPCDAPLASGVAVDGADASSQEV